MAASRSNTPPTQSDITAARRQLIDDLAYLVVCQFRRCNARDSSATDDHIMAPNSSQVHSRQSPEASAVDPPP